MIQSFKSFLSEHYLNLFPKSNPEHAKILDKHADEAHAQLVSSYASQGGIHGNGFKSPSDLKNLDMVKLHIKDKKIVSGAYYKDKGGRKRVAVSTDGTEAGKHSALKVMHDDLKQKRSYAEVSGRSLSVGKKMEGFKDHVVKLKDAKKQLKANGDSAEKPAIDDSETTRHPELAKNMYSSQIGNEKHTKIMIGTVGKTIK